MGENHHSKEEDSYVVEKRWTWKPEPICVVNCPVWIDQ